MRHGNRTVLVVLTCLSLACVPNSHAAAQLPPDILADRHLIEAEQLHAKEDYIGAFRTMQKIIALQREHDIKLPDEFHFKYAQVALSAGSLKIAIDAVNYYLMAKGKAGEFYKEALASFDNTQGRVT